MLLVNKCLNAAVSNQRNMKYNTDDDNMPINAMYIFSQV